MRKVGTVVSSWATLAAAFLLEPLLTLGPWAFGAFTEPAVLPLVLLVLVVVGIARLALAGLRRLRRSAPTTASTASAAEC